MPTVYKIHPAIGIARVGNSPDEFFIGPELVGKFPDPQGGFKDAQCRVKRQAARFRIFAHHDDGTSEEITDAEADIVWTVHLINKKASNPGHNNTESDADLTIDPDTRELDGPNQQKKFDTGTIQFSGAASVTVPLGEIRSDGDNHLLVLGGAGTSASPLDTSIGDFWSNDDWYDDVSDGPVKATARIRATNEDVEVTAAWVIVAPPKFAPQLDSVTTLYDRVMQAMIDGGEISSPSATSYTNDVYPILQRARDTRWVEKVDFGFSGTFFQHTWADPVTSTGLREGIFGRLTAPNDSSRDMPDLRESTRDGRLTPTQYAHMERWKNDNYTNDWAGAPQPQDDVTPDGLDRSALEACVGGAFFPGIEAGGRTASERPIIDPSLYLEAFRLDASIVTPGDISYTMALPWQADFYLCADNWWPVPRPNEVFRQGDTDYLDWDDGITNYQEMVDKWHSLGFIVRQADRYVEVDRCEVPSIQLLTPALNFRDIPHGPMGMVREQPLAITFEVISADTAVTLEYTAGGQPNHSQLVAFNSSDTVGPTAANQVATAHLWIVFKTSSIGAIPTQSVTIREPVSGQEWTVTIDGNTVERKTTATALVLDRSGSMSEDRGDGESKHVSLQQAANIFTDVALDGDGIGIVRYNQDSQRLQQVLPLGGGGLTDINRLGTKDVINSNQLDPDGSTSIGDGIYEGRSILDTAPGSYDHKALVVLTDGKENSARRIADVAADINESTYAIGLGSPANTSAVALQTISANNGGYLLVTGAIDQDNRFRLQKYFLQILSDVSNADVVLDPDGELAQDQVHRIPFKLTEADAGVDVILLTPNSHIVDFRLQTPGGLLLEPWRAQAESGMHYVRSDGVTYYRLVLPAQLQANRFDQRGTWHALLRLGKPRMEPTPGNSQRVDRSILHNPLFTRRHEEGSRRRQLEAARAEDLERYELAGIPNRNWTAGTEHYREDAILSEARGTLPYSLIVHAYSSLSLSANLNQSGYEPGDKIELEVSVTQSGIPVAEGSVDVWAEIGKPDGSKSVLSLKALGEGRFGASTLTSLSGSYEFRVRANGKTLRGRPYTREKLMTAFVWHGSSREESDSLHKCEDVIEKIFHRCNGRMNDLLTCLLSEDIIGTEFEKRMRAAGVNTSGLRKCLEEYLRQGATKEYGEQDR